MLGKQWGAGAPADRSQGMAAHLFLGRFLSIVLVVLFGLAGVARADHFLTHPAAAPLLAEAAPQAGKTAAREAKKLFEKGKEIKVRRDAYVYLTPSNIPKNDRFLKAYDVNKAAKNDANAAPGLLGIARQTYRTQSSAGTANKGYSLANAMRDAVWRKRTAAKLKTLLSERRPSCANDAEAPVPSTPSIGLGTTC